MDTPITAAVHEEFTRRMEVENKRLAEEDHRQNERIKELETEVRQIHELVATVHELAAKMGDMAKAQERQNERLEAIEKRDGEMWRKVTGYIITAVAGIVVGFIFKQIGM